MISNSLRQASGHICELYKHCTINVLATIQGCDSDPSDPNCVNEWENLRLYTLQSPTFHPPPYIPGEWTVLRGFMQLDPCPRLEAGVLSQRDAYS